MPLLWKPSEERKVDSQLHAFLRECGFSDYHDAWRWSVDESTSGDFWAKVAEWSQVAWHSAPESALERDKGSVTGARWFEGGTLNYAEACLRWAKANRDAVAVKALSQTRSDMELTWGDLLSLVGRIRAGLHAAGVRQHDCVAGYLPNTPETVAAMLATASLGAVWTCCAPENGVFGVLDRLAQTRPSVLLAVDGYRYGSKPVQRQVEAEAIRSGLPSVRAAIWVPYLDPESPAPDGWTAWEDFTANEEPVEYRPVEFNHPLYVLFSSGTTGKPKGIVHGHGGILLEHAKALSLHFDLNEEDTFFWFTTTGWMMWNFLASGLLVGATVVLYDGAPSGLWSVMASAEVTCGGVGAGYIVSEMKAGRKPGKGDDLTRLKTLGATGSPLSATAARWVYESVGADLLLASFSGGTDVCSGFVGGSPLHPVWAGEISCRCLGAKVEVFDDDGNPIVGSEGELVLTAPLPSMPVSILGDPDGSLYRSLYFRRFPGVWAHGDRATLTERGTVVITGRSDGTLNRGGVRMGTAEFYAVVDDLDDVVDSLVVHLDDHTGGPGDLILFVVPSAGVDEPALSEHIARSLRTHLSPRHVPDHIEFVAAIPRTLTGKRLEVPVKKILAGAEPSSVVAMNSIADPMSLAPFIEWPRRSAGRQRSRTSR